MTNEVGVVTPKKQPLLPRWLKVLLIVLGLPLLLAVLIWTALDIITRQDLKRAQEEVAQRGWPLTLGELYPDPIPDGNNAALIYQQAFSQYALSDSDEELIIEVLREIDFASLDKDEQAQLHQIVAKSAEVLALLHQAAKREKCQFFVDYEQLFGTPLVHLSNVRALARLATAAALVAAAEGRIDEALRYWKDGVVVGRGPEADRFLISQMVRIACLKISCFGLEALVQGQRLDVNQLGQALETLQGLKFRTGLVRGLQGELALCSSLFSSLDSLKGGTLQTVFDFYSNPVVGPLRQYDERTMLVCMTELIELAEQPYHQIDRQLKDWERRLSQQRIPTLLTRAFVPALSRSLKVLADAEAVLATAQTGVALELYRLSHGYYPDALSDLAPDFLPEIPLDPFDGKPLRYVKSDDRVLVYSIGEDLRDDGGSAEPDTYGDLPDIVFTLRRAPRPTEK